ncbi:MAG: DUF6174 domain-containing protein [Gemmatimonadota bacterium]
MTHSRWVLVPLLALCSLGGCSGILDTEDELAPLYGEVAEHRQKWEAQGLDDYRFTLARSCFCPEEATQPARVEVRGDRVVKVTNIRTGRDLDVRLGLTVEQLFEMIAAAERDGTYLEAAYHPRRGYPVGAVIGTLANDAGVAYSLSDLEAAR